MYFIIIYYSLKLLIKDLLNKKRLKWSKKNRIIYINKYIKYIKSKNLFIKNKCILLTTQNIFYKIIMRYKYAKNERRNRGIRIRV